MRHLRDQDLVGLVFDELAGKERLACRKHLRVCPGCNAAFEALGQAVALLEKVPIEAPPPFAWARLNARIERSGATPDWAEPAWIPLVFGHAAGIFLALLLIFLTGGWLETTPIWHSLLKWSLAAEIGPRGLTALIFFGAGTLVTLALAPVFWWESRRPRNGIVK